MIPLQKWLQAMNAGTRRDVRALIVEGRVTVNGEVVTRFAEPIAPDDCEIAVDGQPVTSAGPRVVLVMHKPIKHLTAIDDAPDGTPGLGRYVPQEALDAGVFPVGRLDYNTQGALLWTNDGPLARRILHPDFSFPKHYAIKIRGHLQDDDPGLDRMRAGMTVGGTTYLPALVTLGERRTRATWIHVTIHEGKHRQLRKMCADCGYQIVKLQRHGLGPIQLGDLNPRCTRPLSDDEIALLLQSLSLDVEASAD